MTGAGLAPEAPYNAARTIHQELMAANRESADGTLGAMLNHYARAKDALDHVYRASCEPGQLWFYGEVLKLVETMNQAHHDTHAAGGHCALCHAVVAVAVKS
jgi:hypothetical protein